MYVPFQNTTRIGIDYDEGNYKFGDINMKGIDAIATIGEDGKIHVAITNIDPNKTVEIDLSFANGSINNAEGETLYSSTIDAINTFEKSDTVSPKPVKLKVSKGNVSLTLNPQSVTVLLIDKK
jgi:alpha-N-arabinofuranosidase